MAKYYCDFMNEITADELYQGLIGYGLFAEKLPPIFDGSDFLSFCLDGKRQGFSNISHRYARFDATRNINIPRTMGIPTPMSHEKLCATLRNNWSKLQEYFKNKTAADVFRKSRIHIRKQNGTSCLFEMNYGQIENDKTGLDISLGRKYLVKADIAQCFPGIYSHAIPWALVGKAVAKSNKSVSLWYNDIDLKVRNSTDAETHGIHIGPHTSNILSEIILCAVDEKLKEYDFVRKIDDYECYVDSEDEATQFLLCLNRNPNEYGLKINQHKTSITSQPTASVGRWTHQVWNLARAINTREMIDFRDIYAFLAQCITIMGENGDNASIVFYGVKTIDHEKLTPEAAECLVKEMTSLALLYPYLVHILDECVYEKYPIPNDELNRYVNKIFGRYIQNDCFDAAAHALQVAVKYDIIINDFDIDEIAGKNDCILLLCALIYCRHFSLGKSLTKLRKSANILNKSAADMEEFWPFVYECLNGSLQGDWKVLKNAGISFLRKEYR